MILQDKVAIVTGAGSGLGRAFALGLAREGARVAVADLAEERASQVAQEIAATGGKALPVVVDVSQTPQVQGAVDRVRFQLGAPDILLNAAGIYPRRSVMEMPDEEWDRMIAIHLRGTFLFCRAVLPDMVQRGNGKIVNVASSIGLKGAVNGAHYAAAKGGIIAFTRSLAMEMAPHGVSVNALCPGQTDTPLWRLGYPPEEADRMASAGNVGRPDDLVGCVVFLCSDQSRPLTGQIMLRDIPMKGL